MPGSGHWVRVRVRVRVRERVRDRVRNRVRDRVRDRVRLCQHCYYPNGAPGRSLGKCNLSTIPSPKTNPTHVTLAELDVSLIEEVRRIGLVRAKVRIRVRAGLGVRVGWG